jgi:two-component system cell cycle sensor histidine kinase/response regulator CckA
MKDPPRTIQDLIEENLLLKQRIQELDKSEEERKKAEEELHQTESRYKTLFAGAAEGILVATLQTKKFNYANPAMCRMFGYTEEEILQLGVEAIHPEESLARVLAEFDAQGRGEKTLAVNIPCLRKDGSLFYADISTTSLLLDGEQCNVGFFTDITDRRQAEDRLRDIQDSYRLLFEHAPYGIVIVDPHTARFVEFNKTAHRQLGYSREEFAKLSIPDIEVIESPEETLKHIENVIREGRSDFETMHRTQQGEIRNIRVTAQMTKISGHAVYHCVWRDITERKQIEEELVVSRNRLSKAEIISRCGNWEFDLGLKKVFASEGARRIYGLLDREWTIQEVQKIPLPEYRAMLDDALMRLVKENRPYSVEFRIQRPDTREIIDIYSIAEYDHHRNVVFGVIQDITKRKQAERELFNEKEKLQTLSENAPFGMALIDKDSRFIYINPKFKNIFGYDLNDIPDGKIWLKKAFPDETLRHEVVAAWLDDLNSAGRGERRPRVFNVTCKDGAIKVISFIPVLLGNGDTIMVVEDITERRRLETQIMNAQKMEAIGTLSGGIAHDFNNILMGIQGYASLMMLDMSTDHPHYEKLKRIEEQVKSAADLTMQLLGFARGGKYLVEPINMNQLIEKTSTMFGRTKKELAIHRKYEKDVWVTEVDQGQIEQVLLNLYLNAWQAMPVGGDLSLETRNTLVSEGYARLYSVAPGKYVRISVSDTGPGMDEKTRERIFEPFFTTKELGRGTGLGLAMVYGIIKNHNGFIDVISEPGQGTTFAFYLPPSEKGIVMEKPAAPKIIRGTETILLVDDEPDVLRVNKAILETLGYRVHAVKNGEEAVSLYEQKKDEIDVVILDMIMPGLSGSETFDRIRELNPSARTILSSGYSLDGQARHIMDKGCNGFIQKPFNVTHLSRKIREVIERPAAKEAALT